MSEWKKYMLSEFIEINPKVTLKSGIQHSFVEMKDLNESRKYVFPSQLKAIKGGARFQNSDTLFARITPCLQNGKICQVQGLKNSVGFGSTEFLVFRGKNGISNTDFIYYLSRYDVVRKFAEQNMIGTSGRQRVSKDVFANLELYLPDLLTQTDIAGILSSLDDKIELNNKINQELETLAQTLFKQWFIDFEFPNENGKPYKSSGGEMVDSELGEIPKGWSVNFIKDLTSQIKPGTNFQPKRTEKGIPFLNVKNINSGFIDTSESKLISEEDYFTVHKVWKPEFMDILISRIGTLGLVAPILSKDLPLAVHYNFILIKPGILSSKFLYFLLKSENFQLKYKSLAKASVQEYVTCKSSAKSGPIESIS
jgi:restriction endonuclease S subunit